MENKERNSKHQRVDEVEDILKELAGLVSSQNPSNTNTSYPIIFIVGCARSGTTLVTQYLAHTEAFCYPSNFISRFFYAPYVGSMLQRLMFDLDIREELFGFLKNNQNFSSELGKTPGPLAPNEFWYYWRRFFNFSEIQRLTEKELSEVDSKGFESGLRSIQAVFQKPLFLKGMIMNWNIPYLAQSIPNSYFIYVERDIRFNAQSLYLARRKFFGTSSKWYSFKPVEYQSIKEYDDVEQVIAQVYYTNRAIKDGLRSLDQGRYIAVNYEEFCKNPSDLVSKISFQWGLTASASAVSFDPTNNVHLDVDQWNYLNEVSARYK